MVEYLTQRDGAEVKKLRKDVLRLGLKGYLFWVLLVTTVAPFSAGALSQGPIVVLGDSLSAGYGIDPRDGWVNLLAQRINRPVVNASVSGETSVGGRIRVATILREHNPSILIVELGANDGLRGLGLSQTRENLRDIVLAARQRDVQVLLLGMKLPPNYGPAYTLGFEQLFEELARTYALPLVPFFLDGVALNTELMQEDGLHPSAAAQPVLLDNIWPALEKMLRP